MARSAYNRIYKAAMKQKFWKQRVFAGLTAVLCAAYALSAPISALGGSAVPCNFAHTHDSFCYDGDGNVICPLPEVVTHEHTEACYELRVQESAQGHIHTDACYTEECIAQICTAPVEHIHSEACYETIFREPATATVEHEHTAACYGRQQGDIVCILAETGGHIHGDGCYLRSDEPLCAMEEGESHTHDESCYGKTLVCTTPESEGHTHCDDCFLWVDVLTCGATDAPAAAEPERVLVCGITEQAAHVHGHGCYEWNRVLICGLEERPAETVEPERVLICNAQILEAHQHTEECLDFSDSVLICEMEAGENHVHNYRCYQNWSFRCMNREDVPEEPVAPPVEQPVEKPAEKPVVVAPVEPDEEPESDPTADVERAKDWEKTFRHVKLTGAWSYDLLAIAQSQLGYRESERNFIVADNGNQKGYTRYGDWYGVQYGDWCAMFASFCLHYAGVEDYPLHCNCSRWIELLMESGSYVSSDVYMPKPGDLVFFDHGRKDPSSDWIPAGADHVAIVAEVIPETQDKPAELVTIEGNKNDSVCYDSYDLADTRIIGYGMLPDGPAANYSCGLDAHEHDADCYNRIELLDCMLPEHSHDEMCRSRNLQYADEFLRVDVTLSNAVYLPENLSLAVEVTGGTEDEAAGFRVELQTDGENYLLPVGVQAHVQVSFADSAAEESVIVTQQNRSGKTVEVEVATDSQQVVTDGFRSVYFTAGRISAFSVLYE